VEECLFVVLDAIVERVVYYFFIVSFCVFGYSAHHVLAHLQETVHLELLVLSHVRVVVGSLHHQQQVEVLIAFGVILQTVHSHQSMCNILNYALHHLRFLGQTE